MIAVLFYVVLCVPGLLTTWLLVTPRFVEPRLRWGIPAPRLKPRYNPDEESIGLTVDHRGLT